MSAALRPAFAILLSATGLLLPPMRSAAAPPDHGKVATEEATPIGDRAIEVEAAYAPCLTTRGAGSFLRTAPATTHALSLALFYGLGEHLDVKVAAGFASLTDEGALPGPARGAGASDLVLGARWRFLTDAARALDATLATTVVVPTGHGGSPGALPVSQGHWSVRSALVASADRGQSTGNVEVALTLPAGGGASGVAPLLDVNLAVGHAFGWLQPIVEVSYQAELARGTPRALAVTAGLSLTSEAGTRLLCGVQQAVWGRDVAQTTAALVAFKLAY